MSNNFAGIPFLHFMGALARWPVKLPQGAAPPPNTVPPSVVPVLINWNVYWQLLGEPTALGINIDLQAASVQASILDRIASVKIDNTGSSCPVYVLFPDTGDVISAAPNTAVTFPCLTNLLQAQIIIEGLTPGFVPTTKIFFYNQKLEPAVDVEINNAVTLYKASPSITRGTTIQNTNYGTPALGDQFFTSAGLSLSAFGQVPIWNTPYPSGFLYITHITVLLTIENFPVGNYLGQIAIRSSGPAGTLLQPQWAASLSNSGALFVPDTQLLNLSGMNLKLDATQSWFLTCDTALPTLSGAVQMLSAFTQTPI